MQALHADFAHTALVNITVLNINDWDPRFRYPQYEFFVPVVSADQGHKV